MVENVKDKWIKLDKPLWFFGNSKESSFRELYNEKYIGLFLKLQNGKTVLLGDCDSHGYIDLSQHNSELSSLEESPITEYYIIDLEKIVKGKVNE